MNSAATKRLAPRRGTRRGPKVERRGIERRVAKAAPVFVPCKAKPGTLEETLLLTIAAIEAGHPAPCLVCISGVMSADGCNNCGSSLE